MYTTDKNNDGTADDRGWITQMKSFEEDSITYMWEPLDGTLHTIDSNMDLGTVTIGDEYKTVTVIVNNLDTDNGDIVEDVWVNLEGMNDEGFYGDGNANWDQYPVTYDGNVTLKVPTGDYRLLLFPMNHKGGQASNGDGTPDEALTDFNTLSWTNADKITVSDAVTVTVALTNSNDLKEVNGTVICKDTTNDSTDNNDDDANCGGWIDAWNGQTGKGSMVNNNGTFEIKGLDSTNYELNYMSFDGSLLLNKADVNVTTASEFDVVIKKEAGQNIESITGRVTTSESNHYVVLIEYDGSNWKVIANEQVDENGDYSFGAMPKPSGKSLVVAVAGRTFTASGASTTAFDSGAVEVFDAEDSMDIPDLGTDLTGTFTLSTPVVTTN